MYTESIRATQIYVGDSYQNLRSVLSRNRFRVIPDNDSHRKGTDCLLPSPSCTSTIAATSGDRPMPVGDCNTATPSHQHPHPPPLVYWTMTRTSHDRM